MLLYKYLLRTFKVFLAEMFNEMHTFDVYYLHIFTKYVLHIGMVKGALFA